MDIQYIQYSRINFIFRIFTFATLPGILLESNNREVKIDVYGRTLTANGKLLNRI